MLPEYDFKGGIRGNRYKEYRQGHIVTIHKTDGTTVVQHLKLEYLTDKNGQAKAIIIPIEL